MFSIKTMCQRVIYLKQGKIVYDGPTEGGIKLYEEDCRSLMPLTTADGPEDWPISITGVTLLDEADAPRTVFRLRGPPEDPAHVRGGAAGPTIPTSSSPSSARTASPAATSAARPTASGAAGLSGSETIELLTPPLKLVAELYTIHVLVREAGLPGAAVRPDRRGPSTSATTCST